MKKEVLAFLSLMVFTCCVLATEVTQVRVWPSPDKTRVVFDLTDEQNYKVFTLENPNRIVVDLKTTTFKAKTHDLDLGETGIVKFRHALKAPHDLRMVLDLNEPLKPKAFILKPEGEYGYRLVIDLEHKTQAKKEVKTQAKEVEATAPKKTPKRAPSPLTRDFVVAIDAGHGGEDPGAIGKHYHTYEKNVVLQVAKELHQLINQQPGMKAVLIRNSDYYVGLRKRTHLARKQGADLFISIHADSFKNTTAEGASVFVLSEKGASSEAARWLAESENRSDLIGGVSLDDKSDVLASVLLDLSQTANQAASEEFAQKILHGLKNVTKLHKNEVQRAGFVVLKSPDIPSILVELGFLSNRNGEKDLKSSHHQRVLAKALLGGIKHYLHKKPLPVVQQKTSAQFAQHKVKKGESLSGIANKYGLSVQEVKTYNNLKSRDVYVGQILKLPVQGAEHG